MEVINEINYTTNSTLEVNAVSFEYQFDGLKSYIDSKFTLNKEGLSSDLYFKVLFLQNRQQDPDFSSAKEYYLGEYEVDKQINVSIDTDISVNNIYVYLKIYNKTSFFLQKYEKTFAQNLVAGSNIITNSFIDLRIQNSNAVIESLSTQKERLYQQSLEQQKLLEQYRDFVEQQGFERGQLGFLSSVLTGAPIRSYGEERSGTMGQVIGGTSPFGQIAGALGSAYMMSDRALKEDIKLVGQSPSGINIYSFKYKNNPDTYQGVIAQEVPEASININGYLAVDYDKVDVDFKKIN